MTTSRTAFWDRIADIAERIDSLSYYQLLGVEVTAAAADIEAAYYRLVPRIHPDRHARQRDPGRKRALVAVYTRIGEAYRVLSDTASRAAYDKALASGDTRITDESLRQDAADAIDPKTRRARDLYLQGKQRLEAGDREGARATLMLAGQFEPDSKAIAEALAQVTAEPAAAPAAPRPTPTPPPVPEPAVRKDVRHRVARPVRVSCSTWERLRTLYTRDISRGGMFLRSTAPLPVGTELQVVLRLPDGRTIELAATVARAVAPDEGTRPPGIGIRFTRAAEALAELEQMIGGMGADDEAAVLEGLIDELVRLRHASPTDALGVPDDADPAIIQQAYRRLEERYHPELYNTYAESRIHEAAAEVRAAMKSAYEALHDLHAAREPEASPEATLGRQALERGEYRDAAVLLRGAVEAAPHLRTLRAAYHAAAGHVARIGGNVALARKHFDTALVFDPGCQEAIRALRGEELK